MPSAAHTGFIFTPVSKTMFAGLLAWTLLVSLSLGWDIFQINEQTKFFATEEARANWNKDLAFRRWATLHGGLYTKPDTRTPPNPFLAHLPDRDVETTDGLKLTLMNPAYMMRQMTEEFKELYGINGSITAQILLNPANKADPWELVALKRFDQGETEIIEVAQIDGAPFLRFMRPVIMEQGCIKCHGHLGFKVGDIRGGVSISVPLTAYWAEREKVALETTLTHLLIWLLGLAALIYLDQRNKRFEIERARYDRSIKDIATGVTTATGDVFFQNLVEHVATVFQVDAAFISIVDKSNTGEANTIAAFMHGKIVDNISYSIQGTPCFGVLKESFCAHPCNIQQLFPEDKLLVDMGAEAYIGKSMLDSNGKAIGLLVIVNCTPLQNIEQTVSLLDIFAARAAGEYERLSTERALRRSQKMDAIGQLSGGIAHDFNNQLGIILGYLDFLKMGVAENKKLADHADTAINAALRCTDLTRQLLSFSRTKPNEKVVVDINAKLIELKTMFARSVTPAIDVEYFLAEQLWLTEADPGEFQDAVLNLVINARDAMPNGGKLLIETNNKYLDEESTAMNQVPHAGEYVQLILSDTGNGMDKATQERIFEPFYTTKAKGKGTGLGMSMVYGFVKRFGGFIHIYSELNVGTTMRLYLPRCTSGETDSEDNSETALQQPTGNESILIVDDEVDLLHLASQYLTDLGYQTHLAKNAEQALQVLTRDTKINLLFSDVVMPGGIDGYELAKQSTLKYPELKVLLTSGFTSKTISHKGMERFAANLLSKPYRKADLAQRIRLVLDEKEN